MIQSLLSLFNTYPDQYCVLGLGGKVNDNNRLFFNFYYGNKALMFLTIGWIVFRIYTYPMLDGRPHELFEPENYMGRWLMPAFPSFSVYLSAALLGIAFCIYIFFRPENSVVRALLTIDLLWLNLLQWSFGFFSAVSHLFLLAHFFGIFMPYSFNKEQGVSKEGTAAIRWYLAGLLVTYTFSGVWKVIGLGYKFLIKTEDINWLSPQGALYNAVISFRSYDFPFTGMEKYFSFPFFWQASFLFMLYIQVFCMLAVCRLPWQMWAGLFLLILHFVNFVAFETTFVVAPLVVTCVFFPYHLFLKKGEYRMVEVSNRMFYGKGMNAVYDRTYSDGSHDLFYGFYACREEMLDRSPIIGGLLYFPFLDIIIQFCWKLRKWFRYRKAL